MTPQQTEVLVGAVVALLSAITAWFARPKVDRAMARRKARKHVEGKSESPLDPPEVK